MTFYATIKKLIAATSEIETFLIISESELILHRFSGTVAPPNRPLRVVLVYLGQSALNHQLTPPAGALEKGPIKRLMVNLSKGINLNRETEAQKALKLAIYLFAVGEVAPARDLVSSFAFDIPYSEKSGVWAIKKEALAFIAIQDQLPDAARKLVNEIFASNPNTDIDDTDWIFEQAIDEIDYYKPRETWSPSLLHDLTQRENLRPFLNYNGAGVPICLCHSVADKK